MGSDVWCREQEAAEAVAATVERADATGRLRAIRKRSKVTVRFVELTETIPVQGPETEIVDRLVFSDFLALLDERDRQVVVLLRSGVTKLTEVVDRTAGGRSC